MRLARVLFLGLLLASIAQAAYYYPRLPERMASHFDASGAANGWSSRASFFQLGGFVVAIVAVVFLGLPALLSRIPASLVNLPNKGYWLHPSRKDASLRRMSQEMIYFGCASLALLIAVFQAVYMANLTQEQRAPGILLWVPITLYMAFTLVWCVRLFLIFRLPADAR